MASDVLLLDSDINVQWTKSTGIWHYALYQNPDVLKNCYVMGDDTEDLMGMTDTSGTIDALVSLDVTIGYRMVINNSGGWIGVNYMLYDGANFLGGYLAQLAPNPDPHTFTYTLPLTGGAGDVSDLRLRLLTTGNNWTFGSAVISVYHIYDVTLNYTEPSTDKAKRELEMSVSSGKHRLSVAPSVMEVAMSSGEYALSAAPSELEMPVAPSNLVMKVDAEGVV